MAQLPSLCGGQFTQKAEGGVSRVSFTELDLVGGWAHGVCGRDRLSSFAALAKLLRSHGIGGYRYSVPHISAIQNEPSTHDNHS